MHPAARPRYDRPLPAVPEPSHRRSPLFGSAAKVAATAALCIGAGLVAERALQHQPRRPTATRLVGSGATVLAFSGLTDSAMEHHRAYFARRSMYAAPTVSALALIAAVRAADPDRPVSRTGQTIFATAALTGLIGLGFHAYNVGKRPGGYRLENLFYAAPLGAPGAVSFAGLFGLAADRVRRHPDPDTGRALALLAALGLLGTTAEAGLLHFRGAFQNPHMYLPVTLPPLTAAVLAAAAWQPDPGTIRTARLLSAATAALGVAGSVFHAYGIHRNMGGWYNWQQMLLQGPPLPAPPGFTGIALAGLGALLLLEQRP